MSRGIPCYQVVEDTYSGTMMQPCRWSSLQLENSARLRHEIDAKFITMFRHLDVNMADIGDNANVDTPVADEINVNQQAPIQAKGIIVRRVVGDLVTKTELMVVPTTEMNALQAEGWGV